MAQHPWTRRDLLKFGAAAALPTFVSARALGLDGNAPASEQVRVGVIGCGGRSRLIAEGKDVKGFNVVAACDCLVSRAEQYVKELSGGAKWGVYSCFRKMIEQEKLDGVMVETTTHARAWIACLAMQMGMDAYIEKPMCLYITEGRHMVNTARKHKRVTQVGTQQRSMPINNWASDLVKNGALGKVHTVMAPNFVGPKKWPGKPGQNMPAGPEGWWDTWTNQADLRPYHPEIHFGWATWWDYDAGGLCFGVSGWGTHSYDQINRALGTDATGPTEILLEETVADRDTGRFAPRKSVGGVVLGDTGDIDTGTDYHGMAKLSGPRAKVTMTFASGTKVKYHLDGDKGPGLGAIFIGEKGKLEINRNKIASNPKDIARRKDNPGPNKRPETAYHIENWIECIKSRGTCTADIEFGQRSSALCDLINIVRAVGKVGTTLHWDPAAERFTDCDEGNAYLTRPRRKGYELPALG